MSNFAHDAEVKAVNLIMPFLMIAATVGFMFGTGGTAIVSNTLGEGNKEKANEYFSLFLYSTFILGVIFGVVSFIFIRSVLDAVFVILLPNGYKLAGAAIATALVRS